MNAVILACSSMARQVAAAQRKMGTDYPVRCVDRRYHAEPKEMRLQLIAALGGLAGEFDTVLVAMGFCGGSWESVYAPVRVVAPRADDCITILLNTARRRAARRRLHHDSAEHRRRAARKSKRAGTHLHQGHGHRTLLARGAARIRLRKVRPRAGARALRQMVRELHARGHNRHGDLRQPRGGLSRAGAPRRGNRALRAAARAGRQCGARKARLGRLG